MSETVTRWSVEIFLRETDGRSHAQARLLTGLQPPLTATGDATVSPHDPLDVPEIGFELATARALRSLADKLLSVGDEDLAGIGD
jgi:hypothetical protein